jgi:hypothetical protein
MLRHISSRCGVRAFYVFSCCGGWVMETDCWGRGKDDYQEAGLWKVEVGYSLLEVIGVRLVGVVFGGIEWCGR